MTMQKQTKIYKLLTYFAILFTAFIFSFIVLYIIYKGFRYVNLDLFSLHYNTQNQSLIPSLYNTVLIIVISLAVAVPVGLFSAIYLEEYVEDKKKIFHLLLAIETLSGIPSIIYGLFGMLFFCIYLKFNISILAGALTASIMILPTIIKVSQESIKAVDKSYREASYALGADKFRTLVKIVIPNATKGILTGIILSVGRIIGESACFIYTSGTLAEFGKLFTSGRTITLHVYILSGEGLYLRQSYATSLVLLIFVIFINLIINIMKGKK